MSTKDHYNIVLSLNILWSFTWLGSVIWLWIQYDWHFVLAGIIS